MLRNKIKNLRKENVRLKKQLEKERKRNERPIFETISDEDFKMCIEKKFPSNLCLFITQQQKLLDKRGGGRRYTKEFKCLCLKIYFLSPKCYSFLSTCFAFPSRRTLSRLTENIRLLPGVNNIILNILKLKVETLQEIDKNCVICFDEMSIKNHLFYNVTTDEVIGFEDLGSGKLFHPAINVLTIMVKGLFNNWKQPFAYYFSHNTVSASNLKNILYEIITELKAIGLKVRVLVGDMGPSNIALSKSLKISPENPYFEIADEQIFFVFDPPHLIKAFRNTLYKYDFVFSSATASWKFIEQLYNIDKNLLCRLVPKLTDVHVHPINLHKMKVSLATQVLSASVANAIGVLISLGHLNVESGETQRIIEMLDKLFDICNSGVLKSQKMFNNAFKGEKYQVDFLNEVLDYFDGVKIINKEGDNVTNKIKSIRCWKITIKSILGLWEVISKEGFKFLLTRRINQDALENFFGTVRRQSGCCVNPTPIQFMRAFKKLFTLRFLNSGGENCGDDYGKILSQLEDFQNIDFFETEVETHSENKNIILNIPLSETDCDYRYHDVEKNSIRYICGYLIKKCLTVHSCEVCKQFANAHQELDETTILSHFKAYENSSRSTFGNLYMPHNNFFIYICMLEKIFKDNLEKLIIKNVLANFIEIFKNITFEHSCCNFPYNYLIKLYTRMKLYYTLKFINKNFKTVQRTGEKSHRKIIIWQHN